MHAKTHMAIATLCYDALPRTAQAFLQLSEVETRYYARIPDDIDHDNLSRTGSDTDHEQYAHTYKLERNDDGTFKHLVGKAPAVLADTPRQMVNAIREGQFDEARRIFGKMMHYTVDLVTIFHLTRELSKEQHSAGEAEIARKLSTLMPVDPAALKLPDPKSLYKSAILVAEETNTLFLERCQTAQAAGSITKDVALCKEMLERCAGFTLAVALYTWRFAESA